LLSIKNKFVKNNIWSVKFNENDYKKEHKKKKMIIPISLKYKYIDNNMWLDFVNKLKNWIDIIFMSFIV